MKADIVANLLECARVTERRDRIDPYVEPFLGQPGCDRNHVLLGNTAVDEAVSQTVAQRLECHEPKVSGQEDHIRPLRAHDESRAELSSHVSRSRRAIAA